jgi:hypothetical protein
MRRELAGGSGLTHCAVVIVPDVPQTVTEVAVHYVELDTA